VKAKDVAEEKEAIQQLNQAQTAEVSSGPTTIGDLIKQQMKNKG